MEVPLTRGATHNSKHSRLVRNKVDTSTESIKTSSNYVLGNIFKNAPQPHLDTNYDALVLDDFWKQNSFVGFLVQCFMEKDDTANAFRDGIVYREEEVTKGTTVLFGVLHIYLLETISHGA